MARPGKSKVDKRLSELSEESSKTHRQIEQIRRSLRKKSAPAPRREHVLKTNVRAERKSFFLTLLFFLVIAFIVYLRLH